MLNHCKHLLRILLRLLHPLEWVTILELAPTDLTLCQIQGKIIANLHRN